MDKNKLKLFIRTQSYLKPYIIPYVFFVIISGVGQFLTFSSVGMFLREIVLLSSSSNSNFTVQKGFLFLFATFIFTCIMGFGIFNIKKIEQKIRITLREEMIDGYIHSEEKSADSISSKEVMNRISVDLTKIIDLVGWIMAGSIYMPVISGFLSFIYLWHIDYRIAILCSIISIIEYYLLRMFSKKRAHLKENETLEKNNIITFLNEEIDGNKEVTTYHLSSKFHILINEKIMKLNKFIHQYNAMNASRLFVSMFYIECIKEIILLIVGAYLSSIGAIVFANIMIAIQLSDQINQMIVSASVLKTFIDEYYVYEKRVFEIIDLEKQKDSRSAAPKAALSMSHVRFSYNNKEVLHDISFSIQLNQKIGIVGKSGCGKTTILKLLLGLYTPTSGIVQKGESLKIGYMSQFPSMFFTSVRNNITLSTNPSSVQKMKESVQQAHADSFIKQNQNGYDNQLSSNEDSYSGGELQRISLSRLLYYDADVFILDEPSSALDYKTESEIKNILNQLNNKTIIVVTHRLSFVDNFDEIIVVNDGNIIETGSPSQLLKQNSFYKKMYAEQQNMN